jgi:tRNA pseudouridine13 synthase
LERFGLRWTDGTSLRGDRRISRLVLTNSDVTPTEDGYILSFTLPKGAFATSVLREVMGVDVDAPSESSHSDTPEDDEGVYDE